MHGEAVVEASVAELMSVFGDLDQHGHWDATLVDAREWKGAGMTAADAKAAGFGAAACAIAGYRAKACREGGYGVDCCGDEGDVAARENIREVGGFGIRPAAARRKEAFDSCVRCHLDALVEHGGELGRG